MSNGESVHRGALSLALQRSGMTATELARAAAPRIGASFETINSTISRLLAGKRSSTGGAEVLEGTLGVARGDLGTAPAYLFVRDGQPLSFGPVLTIFSDAEAAHAARAEIREAFDGATLRAILASDLEGAVRSTFGALGDDERDLVVRRDPSLAELRQLAVLNMAVAAVDPAVREGAAQALADAAEAGLLALDLDALHKLAERRLDVGGVPDDVRGAWARENARLAAVRREAVSR